MNIEVDQSGKIGDTKVPTVLAYSNSEACALFIPASVKRDCIKTLRQEGKTGTTLYLQLFATGLYLLLRDNVNKFGLVKIDVEYPGHDSQVKEHLLNLLARADYPVSSLTIYFDFIGKRSNAHKQALQVFSGRAKPDRIIGYREIMKEFK